MTTFESITIPPENRSLRTLWIVDVPTVATALVTALADQVDGRALPVSPPGLPTSTCTAALVEILLPETCGLTLASQLQMQTNASVAVWSVQPLPLYAWVAWRVGLNGCLDKNSGWSQTVESLQALAQGTSIWPPEIWRRTQAFEARVGWRLRRLSQLDWARWLDLMQGWSPKQLGSRWGLTPQGARKGIGRLCEKLEVADQTEAVQLARSAGLVKMEPEPRWSDAVTLYTVYEQDRGHPS